MRPSNAMTIIVLLVVSASLLGEYVNQTQSVTVLPAIRDNFPSQLSSCDTSLFLWINVGLSNPYVGQLLAVLTLLGSFSASVILCGFLFLSGQNRRGILALASIFLVTALTVILKVLVSRPRPFMVLPGVSLLSVEGGQSFPSGHASRAFSLTYLARGRSRKLRVVGYSLACLAAFSRVYLGVHYPLDVVGGVALGLFSGGIVHHYEKLLVPKVERAMAHLGMASSSKLNTNQE